MGLWRGEGTAQAPRGSLPPPAGGRVRGVCLEKSICCDCGGEPASRELEARLSLHHLEGDQDLGQSQLGSSTVEATIQVLRNMRIVNDPGKTRAEYRPSCNVRPAVPAEVREPGSSAGPELGREGRGTQVSLGEARGIKEATQRGRKKPIGVCLAVMEQVAAVLRARRCGDEKAQHVLGTGTGAV